ncbi:hypothetical protein QT970_14345 [Microcoleus sp. herbarium8]
MSKMRGYPLTPMAIASIEQRSQRSRHEYYCHWCVLTQRNDG